MTATALPPGVTELGRDTARARVRGVSEALPPGERVLWEGAPRADALERHLFLARPLAGYLAAMMAWWALVNRAELATTQYWVTLATQAVLSVGVLLGARYFARAIARSTTYAITDRRVVMRFGIIFPLTINIPLKYVESAAARQHRDGTGQIAIQLDRKESLAWIVLFPHVRPWRFRNPEPLLRGLTDPARVGAVLRDAVLANPTPEGTS